MNMNMNKLEEVLATSKLNELIHKKEEDEKNCKIILMILAIVGAVAAVAGIAYAVYCFLTPVIWKILKKTSKTISMMTFSTKRIRYS